jgi:hypothetical protein
MPSGAKAQKAVWQRWPRNFLEQSWQQPAKDCPIRPGLNANLVFAHGLAELEEAPTIQIQRPGWDSRMGVV